MSSFVFAAPRYVTSMIRGYTPRIQARDAWRLVGVPVLAIVVFVFLWEIGRAHV